MRLIWTSALLVVWFVFNPFSLTAQEVPKSSPKQQVQKDQKDKKKEIERLKREIRQLRRMNQVLRYRVAFAKKLLERYQEALKKRRNPLYSLKEEVRRFVKRLQYAMMRKGWKGVLEEVIRMLRRWSRIFAS